jgi:hypothetical protein
MQIGVFKEEISFFQAHQIQLGLSVANKPGGLVTKRTEALR